ncbi:MAG: acetylserotonin O-methyltransferase [Proteobacteria bacterium]|nr:acetylserotonin O-methyltransferase [Pseudomonadota bacterium]
MRDNAPLKQVLELARIFWDSQVFLTACKLRVFDYLKEPVDAAFVSKKIKCDKRSTEMLLSALVSLGFVSMEKNNYSIKPKYSDFLLSESKKNVLSIIDHYYHMWEEWGKLIDSVRTGKAIEKKVSKELRKEYTKSFITGMDNLTKFQKERILNNLNLRGVRKILDVGSGPATYLREILKKNKDIEGVILDLPDSAEVGREFIKNDGLEKRVKFIEGDLKEVDFGDDYDCIFIFQVLHALDDKTRQLAIKKAFKALKKGGKIYIHEFYLNEKKTYPRENVIFRLNMLIHADGGDNLSTKEIKDIMENAGFKLTKKVVFKKPATVLYEGTKI